MNNPQPSRASRPPQPPRRDDTAGHDSPKPLSDLAIRAARPTCQLKDGASGLWLDVSPAGKAWRTRFTQAGKTRQITLGHYPDMSLTAARAARLDVRRKVQAGHAPVEQAPRPSATLEMAARAWHAYMAANTWSESYGCQVLQRLERHTFPAIGAMALAEVQRRHIIDLLQTCVVAGGKHQADHVRKHLVSFFDEAVLREDVPHNPALGLARKFAPPRRQRQPAVLAIEAARAVLARLEASTAPMAMKLLHRFAALTGVRPSEAREAQWQEIEGDVWEIPAERMKGRRGRQEPHTVFLAAATRDVLAVAALWGRGERWIFPSDAASFGREAPFHRNSLADRLAQALGRRVHVPHGWRATMATILTARHPADRELIQAMLAHQTKGAVASRYDRTTLVMHETRVRALAEEWAALLLEGAPSPYALAGLPEPAPSNVIALRRTG